MFFLYLHQIYESITHKLPNFFTKIILNSLGVCVHNVRRADLVHILYMPRADFQSRADTLNVHRWFWLQFQTCHP